MQKWLLLLLFFVGFHWSTSASVARFVTANNFSEGLNGENNTTETNEVLQWFLEKIHAIFLNFQLEKPERFELLRKVGKV